MRRVTIDGQEVVHICDSYGPGTNHHDCASFDKQRFGDERLETYRTKPGFCAHLAPKPTEPAPRPPGAMSDIVEVSSSKEMSNIEELSSDLSFDSQEELPL